MVSSGFSGSFYTLSKRIVCPGLPNCKSRVCVKASPTEANCSFEHTHTLNTDTMDAAAEDVVVKMFNHFHDQLAIEQEKREVLFLILKVFSPNPNSN